MKEIISIWISPEYAINYSRMFSLLVLTYVILSLSRPGDQTLTDMGNIRISAGLYFTISLLMIAGIISLWLDWPSVAKLSSILLFLYNLITQYNLKGRIILKEFIEDISWSILFTFTGYLLVLFGVPVIVRILYLILIISFAVIWCLRNSFIRAKSNLLLDKIYMLIKGNNSK